MNEPDSLANIPVLNVVQKRGNRLFLWRKMTQAGFLALLFIIPLLGVFRIDVSSGFVVFNQQVWFSDFNLVFGFWLLAACTLIIMYSAIGTGFCGWACPQNTFSSVANTLTSNHLGKRAVIDWEKSKAKLASAKNTWTNWFLLGVKLLLISMFLALIPVVYFFPPGAVWSFVTFAADERLAGSLYWIYSVFVLIAFVNIAVVRHFACRYMCIYRMWQFLFKTRDGLHLHYDANRSSECGKCNYCKTACMVEIDPTQTSTYDSCTNCGACISACDKLHEKSNSTGLLSFRFGLRETRGLDSRRVNARFKDRLLWVAPVWFLGFVLFVWGVMTYESYHLSVYKQEADLSGQISSYRINIANKYYGPRDIRINIEGLSPRDYTLSSNAVHFDTAGRKELVVKLKNHLSSGLHGFIVRASADSGWQSSYRVNHIVNR